MARVARTPGYVSNFVRALKRKLPGATIEVERQRGFDGDRFTVAVLSKKFEKLDWKERHKPLWDTLYEMLTDEQLMKATAIAIRPSELNGGQSPRRNRRPSLSRTSAR
jgi:hypothetical protein